MLQMAFSAFHSPDLLWIVHVLLVIDFASMQRGLTKLLSATNCVIMGKPNTNNRQAKDHVYSVFTFH